MEENVSQIKYDIDGLGSIVLVRTALRVLVELAIEVSGGTECLAKIIGVSRQGIHGWRVGRERPTDENLARLAKAAGFSPKNLAKKLVVKQ